MLYLGTALALVQASKAELPTSASMALALPALAAFITFAFGEWRMS